MIERKITKDIRQYESTVVGGFTKRQLTSLCIAVPLLIGNYLLTNYLQKKLGIDISTIRTLFVVIFVFPVIAVGFITIQGFHFEEYVKHILLRNLNPKMKKRPYQSDNYWRIANNCFDEENNSSVKVDGTYKLPKYHADEKYIKKMTKLDKKAKRRKKPMKSDKNSNLKYIL